MPSTQFDATAQVAINIRKGFASRNADALFYGGGSGGGPVSTAPDNHMSGKDGTKNLKTALAVQRLAVKWHHKVTPSKRLKRHAQSGLLTERAIGETLNEAVGLVDASVAHQRRIRNLFSELETRNKTREEMDSDEEDEVHPAVQAAWQESRTQELRVSKKMNELRDNGDCEDTILPVRTIQQIEAYLSSAVAVLKSYMATGVRVTATEILAFMSQTTFAANSTVALSRWAGEAMETLGSERDRAHALHRENAQVSREATMAQKEIMTLEAKLFHAGKEVESLKAYVARMKAESGDMRAMTSAIKDSVMAAGLPLVTHDDDGEALGAGQATFNMIKKLRETCVSQQDRIERLDFFVEKGKLDLEQAEMTIKHMAQAASSKRARKRAASTAAAKSKRKGSAYGAGTASGDGSRGGKRGGQQPPATPGTKAAGASLAVTAAVSLSPSHSLADQESTAPATGSRAGGGRAESGSPSSASTRTVSNNGGGGGDNDAAVASQTSNASTDQAHGSSGSSATAFGSARAGLQESGGGGGGGAATDRGRPAVSVSASTAVDSYDGTVERPEAGGMRTRATRGNNSNGGNNGSDSIAGTRRRTQGGGVEGADAGRRGESDGDQDLQKALAGGRVSSPPAESARHAAGGDAGQQQRPPLQEDGSRDLSGEGNGRHQHQHQILPGKAVQDLGNIQTHENEKSMEGEEDDQGEGCETDRTNGIKKKPLGEEPPGGSHASELVTEENMEMEQTGLGMDHDDVGEIQNGSHQQQQQQKQQQQHLGPSSGGGGMNKRAHGNEKASGDDGDNTEGPEGDYDDDGSGDSVVGASLPRKIVLRMVGEGDAGGQEEAQEEAQEEEKDADGTADRTNRHEQQVAAVKGLTDAMDKIFDATPGIDTATRIQLSSTLGNQVALFKETVQRDMKEMAEEMSATATMESLALVTELAKRDTRITQLSSRVEDLQTRLIKINDAHAVELKSLHELASEGRKRVLEDLEESSSAGEYTVRFPTIEGSPQEPQHQQQQRFFVEGGEAGHAGTVGTSTIGMDGEGERHSYHEEGEGAVERRARRQEKGRENRGQLREDGRHTRLRGGDPPFLGVDHEHHHEAGDTGERGIHRRGRAGRTGGGVPPRQVGSVVGGDRPASSGSNGGGGGGGGIVSRIRSPPSARTPVDGGDERSAHWEASTGIGLLRRGKSAGTFLLEEHALQQHSDVGPGPGGDGGNGFGNASGARGEQGGPGKRLASNTNGDRDSHDPSARTSKGDVSSSPDRYQDEDQRTVSALTTDTSFTIENLDVGMMTPPLDQRKRQHHHSPQRQRGGVEADGSGSNDIRPTGNAAESSRGGAGKLTQTAPGGAGTLDPGMPAPAATIQELQGRARLQHMPKTLGDVVVAAGPGRSEGVNDPHMAVNGAATGQVIPCRKNKHRKGEGKPDGVRAGSEVAREGGDADDAANFSGNEADGGGNDNKTQKQQRALQAFLQGADETQANLAFVALRQEPFLVEEFDYLANQLRDLHEATNGAVPRHLSHGELRDRFRELSARSAPLLRRVRARYRRLHARWAAKLLESLSSRGLAAGDADVSLTCSLCGYDWRRAQPRGNRRRPAFHGMKRGNAPGRVTEGHRYNYQQQRRHHPEPGSSGGRMPKRENVEQGHGLLGAVGGGAGGAVIVPGMLEGWKDKGNDDSVLQVGGGGGGRQPPGDTSQAEPSLLSEQALFLHSISAPNIGGIGDCSGDGPGRGGGGGAGGAVDGGGILSNGSCQMTSEAERGLDGGRGDLTMTAATRRKRDILPPVAL